VFLFDEPLSNLDAKLRVQTRIELKKLHERLATTAIYVTHDQVEAMTMGDRIVVMKDGFIQQVGSPLELYNAPANMFVAGFLGSPAMNFFQAELTGSGDALSLATEHFSIDLQPDQIQQVRGHRDKQVTVGIRPEDFSEAGEHQPGRTIQTFIEVIEPIGSETYIDVDAGSCSLIARVGRKTRVRPHQNFILEPIVDNLHLFDLQTEEAILRKELSAA
jgi:multiple sugar transport system ATP-binding protein